MLKKISLNLALIAVVFVMLGNANASTISVIPSSQDVLLGATFSVNVSGSLFDPATAGGGLSITWNPAILQYSNFTWTFPGDKTFENVDSSNTSAGSLNFTVTNFSSANLGAFDIATLSFVAIGLGSSILDLGAFIGQSQPWVDGGYAILNPQPTLIDGSVNVVPIPAAVWLLGSGVVGLVALKRRKKA